MNKQIETVVDSERGCGWRKPGGIYLRSSGVMVPCGKLPVPLTVCPCCHAGIKPARGWTWIEPRPLLLKYICEYLKTPGDERAKHCDTCVMNQPPERVGLLWVGEKFYPRPADWLAEAAKLGVSRRIPRVPEGFKLGDWVFMAHRCAIQIPGIDPDGCKCPMPETGALVHLPDCGGRIFQPAIFHAFKPDRIEYVTKGDETPEQIEHLRKRGLTPVKVVRDVDLAQGPLAKSHPEEAPGHADGLQAQDEAEAEAEALKIEGRQP